MWQDGMLPLLALLLFAAAPVAMADGSRLDLQGKTLKVATLLEVPFSFKQGDNSSSIRGFYIDILDLLAEELNFKYNLYVVPDNKYGAQLPNGTWNGLIREVIDGELQEAESYAALFLMPFAPSTWILVILFYFICTALAFTLWLLSPYEQGEPQLDQIPILRRSKKSACSSFMLVTGGLFSPAIRILASVWWLFTLVTVACYIGNMGSVLNDRLAIKRLQPPFESFEELVGQSKIPYGVLKGAASHNMFKSSKLPSFKRADKYLRDNPDSLANTVLQGISRAKTGNYAFLAESLTAEYYTSINCDLIAAATGITTLDFALAVAKNSSLRCILNEAILKVKMSGQLTATKDIWWTKNRDCSDQLSFEAKSMALMPGDFACLYGLVLIGALVALLALPVEMYIKNALPFKLLPSRGGGTTAAAAGAGATPAASTAAVAGAAPEAAAAPAAAGPSSSAA
uniref:Glutamate receptor n=1 Tax=Macrostomum lignano TaxID=282301 RepID=A0A1I8IYI3_9PLAT